ncbi:YceI family protein [Amycolatopsis sp. cmx-8-4]|uniref:YceI family protein n=1 Tax=Amycolatopsis sp. cmx-8-4 TaxID=2790947 RepID=UPI0039798D57
MTTTVSSPSPRNTHRGRRWTRRILITLAALVLLLVASTVLYVKLAPVPAPLALHATTSAPSGPLTGRWDVTTGSTAGFRIRQTVLFASNDVVQRTESVTGSLTITGKKVTAGRFTVDLTTLTTDGKPTPQLAISLDTAQHPDAVVAVTTPLTIDPAVTPVTIPGQLSLRGHSHPVTITLTTRQDSDTLQTAGTIPVTFSDWAIPGPAGYGPFGSLGRPRHRRVPPRPPPPLSRKSCSAAVSRTALSASAVSPCRYGGMRELPALEGPSVVLGVQPLASGHDGTRWPRATAASGRVVVPGFLPQLARSAKPVPSRRRTTPIASKASGSIDTGHRRSTSNPAE